MSRRLSEIVADIDTELRKIQAVPLLDKHKPALRALELHREALAVIGARLLRVEDLAGARDVTL